VGEANLRDDFPHRTKSHFFVFLWPLRFSSPICVLTQKKINEERIEVLLTFESLEKPSNMLIFKFPALSIILSMTAGLSVSLLFLFFYFTNPSLHSNLDDQDVRIAESCFSGENSRFSSLEKGYQRGKKY
jgi:hypothetical protein